MRRHAQRRVPGDRVGHLARLPQEYTASLDVTFRVSGTEQSIQATRDAFADALNGRWPLLEQLADGCGDPKLPAGRLPCSGWQRSGERLGCAIPATLRIPRSGL